MFARQVNIAGTTPVDDPSYRYRMPAIYGKIEGKSGKTVIPNICDVALSLHRSPEEVTKFFGYALSTRAKYSEETKRTVVCGKPTDRELREIIHKYIEDFVLCPVCGLPETSYKIKSGCVYHKCAACGEKRMVDVNKERNHKLCTFIVGRKKKKGSKKKDQAVLR
jgi:translation initiation factor 2 beta subunit (eIF-2beta)/eIF-5